MEETLYKPLSDENIYDPWQDPQIQQMRQRLAAIQNESIVYVTWKLWHLHTEPGLTTEKLDRYQKLVTAIQSLSAEKPRELIRDELSKLRGTFYGTNLGRLREVLDALTRINTEYAEKCTTSDILKYRLLGK